MSEQTSHEDVLEFAQKTIAFLSEHHIVPEPKCYEVVFQYISAENPEIVRAFSNATDKEQTINQDFILRLYNNVLSYETLARTVDSVSTLLSDQLTEVTGSVSGADSELSVFSDLLTGVSNDLDNGVPFDPELTVRLSGAVHKMNDRIKDLETNLEASNSEIQKLQGYLETVRQEANIDPLTGLFTRKRYEQFISQAVRSCIETEEDLCIVQLEVDNYEAFRQKWGQSTSEQILRYLGVALKENTKGRDMAARHTATSFALILPRTQLEGAKTVCEHIRNTVERKRIVKKSTGEFLGRVTISIGIATYKKGDSIGFFNMRCERSLMAARLNGRNCTITEQEAEDILSQSGGSVAHIA